MSRFRLCAALVVFAAAPALAQQPQPGIPVPRLDTVFPMGAKAGTVVPEFVLAGADLEDVEHLIFSHAGIKGEVLPPPPGLVHELPAGFPAWGKEVYPWNQPVVFRAGRYMVHEVREPRGEIMFPMPKELWE